VVYRPTELPSAAEFIEIWQDLARRNGLAGIHFVAHVLNSERPYDYRSNGFTGVIAADAFRVSNVGALQRSLRWYRARHGHSSMLQIAFRPLRTLTRAIYLKGQTQLRTHLRKPKVFEYSEAMLHFLDNVTSEPHSYPCVVPNWDNSPRSGAKAVIMHNSTPELFRKHLREALRLVAERPLEDRILFVKSWNEWAEGNYLEPDQKFGRQYLDVIADDVLMADPRVPAAE